MKIPPGNKEQCDLLQRWLKNFQEDLERAGIQVFLDVRDMQGHLDTTMRQRLADSDFVLPILTPRFLERPWMKKLI